MPRFTMRTFTMATGFAGASGSDALSALFIACRDLADDSDDESRIHIHKLEIDCRFILGVNLEDAGLRHDATPQRGLISWGLSG